MFYCEVVANNKKYKVTVTDNECVAGVVELESGHLNGSYCKVYENDGVTECADLYIRKRIGDVAKRHINKRINVVNQKLHSAVDN